jgi:anti-sigma factor RsiW
MREEPREEAREQRGEPLPWCASPAARAAVVGGAPAGAVFSAAATGEMEREWLGSK